MFFKINYIWDADVVIKVYIHVIRTTENKIKLTRTLRQPLVFGKSFELTTTNLPPK